MQEGNSRLFQYPLSMFKMFKRLPSFPDIVPVYAVIASMFFAWSILQFFWYLPSWLYFMRLSDLAGVFSYVMASSFLESLAFLFILLLLGFVLPSAYLKDEFIVRGASISLVVIGAFMLYFRLNVANQFKFPVPWYGILTILAALGVAILSTKLRPIRQALTWLSDRLIVFLYILVPLSVLSLLVIAVRNIG